MPKNIKFAEYNECDAYYLISEKDLSNIKVPGINLVETKEFDKSKIDKNSKRIELSKASIIIMIILLALGFII